MNRKGFTLIELLAIIVVIGIVAVLVAPSIIKSFNTSKEKAYNLLINNIRTAGENYYLECENGNLKSINSKYCNQNDSKITVTLNELVELGILKASDNNNSIKNPQNDKDIGNCSITIEKEIGDYSKTTFDITIPEDTCFTD